MTDNYGSGGYPDQGSQAGSMAGGATGYGAIAQLLVHLASQNIGQGVDQGQAEQNKITGGKDINAQFNSPFGYANTLGASSFPGAEKMLSANQKPMAVAPAQNYQPSPQHNAYQYSSPWAGAYANNTGGY